ncbi:MAG TPA: hypothetical protein VJT31_17025 [Rugosimonospora sp.]|nr:hypothetical protein [Rugosimonospora sp.]
MNLYWDFWDPAYTRPVADDTAPGQDSTASVDPDVELPATAWCPREAPATVRAPDVVLFVDGVLRNEARGWIVDEEGDSHPALAASYAAGVVRCDLAGGVAEAVAPRVERAVLTAAPVVAAVGSGPSRYRAIRTPAGDHQQLDGKLRGLMASLEVQVSEAARESTVDGDLLVADGRLRGRQSLPRTIGYVKTQGTRYLPVELVKVVTGLPGGTRTPVFRLSTLYSWYLRLPGPSRGPWAGIVRVECSGDLSTQEAIALADLSTVTLPRFASNPYKDPRAPQNLVPIAGLERRLRALLGDPRLLHRTLVRSAQ